MDWTAVWDAPRPYLHPVRSRAGALLTVEAPADHPWHHALWFTIKFVNGENFWEEYGEFGLLRTRSVVDLPTGGVQATIDWVRPGSDEVALTETRSLTPLDLGAGAYGIDWLEELTPVVDTVFDRTPFSTWGGYGGLTWRGSPDWRDTVLILPDGSRQDRLLGERAAWCALHGVAPLPDGTDAACGIVLADHPDNPRFPTPWYGSNRADTYGEGWANFLNAAFLWHEPVEVAGGATLRLRHLVIVRDGEFDGARVADDVADWVLS
jgi:Methane oxygenase PmoA